MRWTPRPRVQQSIGLTASAGVERYYGACVESVQGESNTDNNCSAAVKITVSEQESSEDDDGSEAAASESSEEVTEDFLIPEPSQPPRTVRENFGLTSFYQQWIDVDGYPVVASENVNPYAVKEAAWLIRQLMSHRPDVLQVMVQNEASHSVMAYNEMTTQLPCTQPSPTRFLLGSARARFGGARIQFWRGKPAELSG